MVSSQDEFSSIFRCCKKWHEKETFPEGNFGLNHCDTIYFGAGNNSEWNAFFYCDILMV